MRFSIGFGSKKFPIKGNATRKTKVDFIRLIYVRKQDILAD
jgi:hypothetical protein